MTEDASPIDNYLSQEIPRIISLLEGSRVREMIIENAHVSVRLRRAEQTDSNREDATIDLQVQERTATPGPRVVTAPMVGVFYVSEQPGRAPLISTGDRVEKGTLIGIIDALQVPTDVEADVAGVVERILVEDGQSVEYGQPLIEVTVDG